MKWHRSIHDSVWSHYVQYDVWAPLFWNQRQIMMQWSITAANYTFNNPEWDDNIEAPKNLIKQLLDINQRRDSSQAGIGTSILSHSSFSPLIYSFFSPLPIYALLLPCWLQQTVEASEDIGAPFVDSEQYTLWTRCWFGADFLHLCFDFVLSRLFSTERNRWFSRIRKIKKLHIFIKPADFSAAQQIWEWKWL